MKTPGSRPWGSWFTVQMDSARLALGAFFHVRMAWLVPLVIVLFLIALLLAMLSSAGPLAPFVYPLL